MLSHNNIAVNCEQGGVKIGDAPIALPTTNEHQDVSPSVLPFFHIYGFTVLMISKLSMGVKIVTLPEFKPSTFMGSIKDHKATLLHVVPPIRKLTTNFELNDLYWYSQQFDCSNLFGTPRWSEFKRFANSSYSDEWCSTTRCPWCWTILCKVWVEFLYIFQYLNLIQSVFILWIERRMRQSFKVMDWQRPHQLRCWICPEIQSLHLWVFQLRPQDARL